MISLRYRDEEFEDKIYKEFYEDTKDEWSQREQPTIRDFIKWAIIRGWFKDTYINCSQNDVSIVSSPKPSI